MQEIIRNALITLTTIGTILGIYFKAVDEFIINFVKMKYKNIPGKKSMFNIVIQLLGYIFISIYLIFCVLILINVIISIKTGNWWNINSGLNNAFNFKRIEIADAIAFIFIICFLGSIACVYLLFVFVIPIFKSKFENKKFQPESKMIKNINFLGIFIVIVSISLEGVLLYSVANNGIKPIRYNGIYIFQNNISDQNMNSLVIFTFLTFISVTTCLLLNSVRQVYKEICSEDMYILITDNEYISTRCYLEYDEFYLNIENDTEYYIKKSDVKKIKKLKVPYNKIEY